MAPEIQTLLGLGARQSTSAQLAFDELARDTAKALLLAVVNCLGTIEAMWSLGVATAEHGWSYHVHDAAEATLAVVSRLITHQAALVFIASHLADIVPAIENNPRVCLLHFSADLTGERPVFDYRLRSGISTQRLGMILLQQEGVLELLERSSGLS